MDIKELESVCAVYHCGSFAEAAFQTAFSASVISKHVNRIEEELGCKLFSRTSGKKGSLLTAEGEQLMPHLLQITRLARLVSNMVHEMQEETTVLNISGIKTMQGSAIDRLLAGFSVQRPEITINTTYMNLKETIHAIDTMDLDCTLLMLYSSPPSSMVAAIKQEGSEDIRVCVNKVQSEMQIALPDTHPLAQATSVDLKDIAHETFLFDLMSEYYPKSVARILELSGKSFEQIKKKYVDSTQQNMVLEIVAAGGGVFPVGSRQKINFPGVVFLPVRNWTTDASLLFVYHAQNCRKSFQSFKKHVQSVLNFTEA